MTKTNETDPIKIPGTIFPGDGVSPDNIHLTIGIEITGAHDFPILIGGGGYITKTNDANTFQVPDQVIAGGGIAPKNIHLFVGIEIPGTHDFPALIAGRG